MNDYTKRFLRKLYTNSHYGGIDQTDVNIYVESLLSDIDPIKPEKSIKAHSFINKDFSGGLARLLSSSINYDNYVIKLRRITPTR